MRPFGPMAHFASGTAPALSGAPTLAGTAEIGQTLTGTDGSYSGTEPITVSDYQWQRSPDGSTGWADISGATSANYTAVAADAQRYLRRGEVASNAFGSADRAYSAASGKVLGIAFVGATTGGAANAVYDVSLDGTLSGGLADTPEEGDLVVVAVCTTCVSNLDVTATADGSTAYTEVGDWYGNGGADNNFALFYRRQTATPDGFVRVGPASGNNNYASAACIQVWRGVDATTPLDVAVQQAGVYKSNDANPPAITPTTAGAMVLAIASCGQIVENQADPRTSGWTPSTYRRQDGGVLNVKLAIEAQAWAGSGAVDPPAWSDPGTYSGDYHDPYWMAATVALRPAG